MSYVAKKKVTVPNGDSSKAIRTKYLDTENDTVQLMCDKNGLVFMRCFRAFSNVVLVEKSGCSASLEIFPDGRNDAENFKKS